MKPKESPKKTEQPTEKDGDGTMIGSGSQEWLLKQFANIDHAFKPKTKPQKESPPPPPENEA